MPNIDQMTISREAELNAPTHLDLFSGIGGFAIAAQRCGYTTIGFCEKEPYAQQILKERFGAEDSRIHSNTNGGNGSAEPREQQKELAAQHHGIRPRLHPDIFTLDGSDYAGVDLLTGGFPCQPFSVAGKRLGKADDRAIWPEMLRVIREAKPTWIIGENVAGIVTMELDNILSDLEGIGYTAWPLVIPACAVDARHRRDRVWIVAHAEHVGSKVRYAEHPELAEQGEANHAVPFGSTVAVADEPRPQGRNGAELRECGRERATGAGDPRQDNAGTGQPQPDLGGMADGLPEGLDGGEEFCQWPEEDPGTPRVATGVKHRAHRLRGLGNAIVVQVAEMIIREIASLGEPKAGRKLVGQ